MTHAGRALLLAALAASAAGLSARAPEARAEGPPARREPYAGYLFPAGGRRGTVVRITAGGQNLAGVRDAFVSGEGVHASVVLYEGGFILLNAEQAREVRRLIAARREELKAAAAGKPAPPARPFAPAAPPAAPAGRPPGADGAKPADPKAEAVPLPNHPLLRDLGRLDLDGLERLEAKLLRRRDRRQVNVQISETVAVEVSIDADAVPGDREIRLWTPAGLTNPVRFEVGAMPEILEPPEREDEVPPAASSGPAAARAAAPSGATSLMPPFLLNGQILPGDADRFRFRAMEGQRLVLRGEARRLLPYLADAVPGWFQAVLTLYDGAGREVASADAWRFDPDPVLLFEVPADGEYVLEVRDALWRGREDFVYRVSVAESPFVTGMFPLGGGAGTAAVSSVQGWNLPGRLLPLDTGLVGGTVRRATVVLGDLPSNPVAYVVDALPETDEAEPNDSIATAEALPSVPRVLNGRIARPGDVDVFRFAGRAGDEVAAEVQARRLGSPLDSLLRVSDASGRVLAWNDDAEDPESGLLTHHADSRVRLRLPASGSYFISVADAEGHGGEEYAYRLRIGPPRPDFAALLSASSLNVPAGRAVPVRVRAVRKDGFEGEVEVVLVGATAGFSLDGARIPAGRDSVRMTLTAPAAPPPLPVVLHLEARARIRGEAVVRAVTPADDRMQAFAYHHLVPAMELVAAVVGPKRAGLAPRPLDAGPVRVPAGGFALARFRAPRSFLPAGVRFVASEPPPGVTLGDVVAIPEGFAIPVKADAAAAKPGPADNLILEAILDVANQRAGAAGAKRGPSYSLGYLPAVPMEITAPAAGSGSGGSHP